MKIAYISVKFAWFIGIGNVLLFVRLAASFGRRGSHGSMSNRSPSQGSDPSPAGSPPSPRRRAIVHGSAPGLRLGSEAGHHIGSAAFVGIQLQQTFFLSILQKFAKGPVTVIGLVE